MDRIDFNSPAVLANVAALRSTPRVRPAESAEILARIVPASIHRSPAVERLVAARVAARAALESGRSPAEPTLQLYQHPASRSEAGTALHAGRLLDVNA